MNDQERLMSNLYNKSEIYAKEIEKLEIHLNMVESKLKKVKFAFYPYLLYYLGLIPILYLLSTFLAENDGPIATPETFIISVYLLFLPLVSYHFLKALYVKNHNNEKKEYDWFPPSPILPTLGMRKKIIYQEELNFVVEMKKVQWTLNEYYQYRELINKMIKQLKNDAEFVDVEDYKTKLNDMEVYEEIGVARAIPSEVLKRYKTLLSILQIIIFVLVNFIFPFPRLHHYYRYY